MKSKEEERVRLLWVCMTAREETIGSARMSDEGDPPSLPPYSPPPQFKLLSTPPLLPEGLPDNAELWLVRIQDSHLGPDELTGKRVPLAFDSSHGKMGCFENSKGSQFEILDLHDVAGVQPFAFLPRGDSSLEISKVARQVAIVRSLEPVSLSRPGDRHPSSGADGHTPTRIKQEESHGGSASLSTGVGGLSTVESLQDDEERISTGKVGKSGKKSKRGKSNSEPNLSPVGHSHKDMEAQEHTPSSKKKSRKHKSAEGK